MNQLIMPGTPRTIPGGQTPGFAELRAGNLGVRLAVGVDELEAAQALRYRIFYQEMGAVPQAAMLASGRDCDAFDAIADHLLVVDHDLGEGPGSVVGTYRLIRQDVAENFGRYYSEDEYDISALKNAPGRKLELGRSCIAASYRSGAVMQLLWRGIAAYVFHHGINMMFGCASLAGTDPDAIGVALTYLATNHLAPEAIRPRALPARYIEMRRVDTAGLATRQALLQLPPLIKGYLRLGGLVGDGAVIDHQFNTTDIAIVVQTDMVTEKYYRHYEREAR